MTPWYTAGSAWTTPHLQSYRHNCWACGRFIWNHSLGTYECRRCEVLWHAHCTILTLSSGDRSILGGEGRLIDHATEYAPSPA